jgi:selenocysteine-specific elongation factor
MTGTVLGGQVKVGDNIEIPNLRVEKKVKSMQMFRKPVQSAHQGDRLGICVA